MAYNTSAIGRTEKTTVEPILGHMDRSSTRASNGVCQPASNGVCQPDGGPNVEQSNCLLSKTEIKALIARGELTTRRIGTITPRHNNVLKKITVWTFTIYRVFRTLQNTA